LNDELDSQSASELFFRFSCALFLYCIVTDLTDGTSTDSKIMIMRFRFLGEGTTSSDDAGETSKLLAISSSSSASLVDETMFVEWENTASDLLFFDGERCSTLSSTSFWSLRFLGVVGR